MDLELMSYLIFPAHQAEFQAASWHQSFWIYLHKALLCLILSKSLFFDRYITLTPFPPSNPWHQKEQQSEVASLLWRGSAQYGAVLEHGDGYGHEVCGYEPGRDLSWKSGFPRAACLPWSPGDISTAGGELWACGGHSQSLAATRWEKECFSLPKALEHSPHPLSCAFFPLTACLHRYNPVPNVFLTIHWQLWQPRAIKTWGNCSIECLLLLN